MTDELPSLKEITDSPRWAELDPEQKRKVMDGWQGEALKQASETEGFTPEHASKLGQAVQTAYQMSVPFEPVATRTPGQIGSFSTGRVDILDSSLAQPVMAPIPTIAGTGPDLEPVGGPQTWGEFLSWSPLQEYGVQLSPKQISEHPLLVGIDDLVGKQQADEIRKGIGEGVSEQVNGLLNFFTSAPGVALLATGSYGAPARKLIGAAFTGAIVKELPNQVSDFMAAKTPSEKWRTGVHLVSSALLGGGIGANVIARSRAIPGATEPQSRGQTESSQPPPQPQQQPPPTGGQQPPPRTGPQSQPPPKQPPPLRPTAGMTQAEFNAFMDQAHASGDLGAATEAVKMNGGKRFSNWARTVKGTEGFDFAQGVIKGWGNQQWAEFKAQRATPQNEPAAATAKPGVEPTQPMAGPPQGSAGGTPVGTRPEGAQGTGGRTGVPEGTGGGTGPGGTESAAATLERLAPQTAAVVRAEQPTPTGVTPSEITKPSQEAPSRPANQVPAAGGTAADVGQVSGGIPAAESGRQGPNRPGAAGTGEQQAAVAGGTPSADQIQSAVEILRGEAPGPAPPLAEGGAPAVPQPAVEGPAKESPQTITMWSSSEPKKGKANYFSDKSDDADAYSLGRKSKQYSVTVRKPFNPETSKDANLLELYEKLGGLYEAPQNKRFIKELKDRGYDSVIGVEGGYGGASKWIVTYEESPTISSTQPPREEATNVQEKVQRREWQVATPTANEPTVTSTSSASQPTPDPRISQAVDIATQLDPQNTGPLLGAFQHTAKAGYSGREAQTAAFSLYASLADNAAIRSVGEFLKKTKDIERLIRESAPPAPPAGVPPTAPEAAPRPAEAAAAGAPKETEIVPSSGVIAPRAIELLKQADRFYGESSNHRLFTARSHARQYNEYASGRDPEVARATHGNVTVIITQSGQQFAEHVNLPGFPVPIGNENAIRWSPAIKTKYGVSQKQFNALPLARQAQIIAEHFASIKSGGSSPPVESYIAHSIAQLIDF